MLEDEGIVGLAQATIDHTTNLACHVASATTHTAFHLVVGASNNVGRLLTGHHDSNSNDNEKRTDQQCMLLENGDNSSHNNKETPFVLKLALDVTDIVLGAISPMLGHNKNNRTATHIVERKDEYYNHIRNQSIPIDFELITAETGSIISTSSTCQFYDALESIQESVNEEESSSNAEDDSVYYDADADADELWGLSLVSTNSLRYSTSSDDSSTDRPILEKILVTSEEKQCATRSIPENVLVTTEEKENLTLVNDSKPVCATPINLDGKFESIQPKGMGKKVSSTNTDSTMLESFDMDSSDDDDDAPTLPTFYLDVDEELIPIVDTNCKKDGQFYIISNAADNHIPFNNMLDSLVNESLAIADGVSSKVVWKPDGHTKKVLKRHNKSDTDEWNQMLEKEVLKYTSATGSPMLKTQGIVNMSSFHLKELLLDCDRVQLFNKHSLGKEDILTYTNVKNGNAKIVKNIMKIPMVGTTLETLCLTHSRCIENDGYIIVSQSACQSGVDNRCNPQCSVSILRSLPNSRKTELTTITQTSSLPIPKFLLNKVGEMCASDFFNNLRSLCIFEEKDKVAEDNEGYSEFLEFLEK